MKEQKNQTPAAWDLKALEENWLEALNSAAKESKTETPFLRFRRQAEQASSFEQILERWPSMGGAERGEAWEALISNIAERAAQPLPVCVQCGECCRGASPTLMLDDLELLKEEKIPWRQLITLRVGEPVHSSMTGDAFYLTEERIKIREKTGKKECVFLDGETNTCANYPNRPMQCRAQACWDPKLAMNIAEEPYLTRRHIFKDVEVLLELLDEHDRRCSFDKLKESFDDLKRTEGKTIEAVLNILAFDDHFRNFVRQNLKIPEDTMDLVFGRSLSDLVRLFGFRVEIDPDGTHTLLPEKS